MIFRVSLGLANIRPKNKPIMIPKISESFIVSPL